MTAFKHSIWSLNRFALPALLAALIGGLPIAGGADQDAAAKKTSPAVVFSLNRSAVEVAKSLSSQMRDRRDVSISPDVHANVLIVRGNKEAVEEVKGFLKVLDTPFQTVTYKVSIAVSGEGTDTQILDELELSTLDNNKAKIQFGQQVAVPTGVTRVSSGRSVRSYSQQSTGTIVQVQPRVSNGKILTDIMLEKSWVDGPLSESDDDDVAGQYSTFSVSFDSTLALQDGVPQTLRAKATSSPGGQRSVVITVTATTKSAPKEKTSGRDSKPTVRDTPTRPMPPTRFGGGGGRGAGGGRPSGAPNSQSARPRPSQIQSYNGLQLFSRIDTNNDQLISQEEWNSQSISKVFSDRGFKFSDGMNQTKFETAMAEMVKTFRSRPTTGNEPSKSSLGNNDVDGGTANSKTKDRHNQDGEKGSDRKRKDSESKSDRKPS